MGSPIAAEATREDRVEQVQFRGTNPEADKTSQLLLEDVFGIIKSHEESSKRNNTDSEQDSQWIPAGQEGLDHSKNTIAKAGEVANYLSKGGKFRDAGGRELAAQFIKSLQDERSSLAEHREGALEYAGTDKTKDQAKGIPEPAYQKAMRLNNDIAETAKQLLDPASTDKTKISDILKKIDENATAIRTALKDTDGTAGKDQRDAIEEAKVISTNAVALLKFPNLEKGLRQLLYKDILSKSGLMNNELKDAPIEVAQAKHDQDALALGNRLEALIKRAMDNPNAKDAGDNLNTIKQAIAGLHNDNHTGVEDFVQNDRNHDIKQEPIYMATNKKDSQNNSDIILEFTKIYPDWVKLKK